MQKIKIKIGGRNWNKLELELELELVLIKMMQPDPTNLLSSVSAKWPDFSYCHCVGMLVSQNTLHFHETINV